MKRRSSEPMPTPSRPRSRFEGHVALVTGGSLGIGLATVERLLSEGAKVAFCGRDADRGREVEATLGTPSARFIACDVADEAEIARLMEECASELGPPTVLVNNAGVNANFDAAEMTTDEWQRFFDVDLRASWLTAKHALPHMLSTGGGSIVNVSSIHGVVTLEGFFPYAAAKSGLLGLTRSLALDYGRHGVRVNAVCPGFTRTRLVQQSIELNDDQAAAEAAMVAGVALRRIAEPEEVAATIAFLASDEAGYVTGATLLVDGGLTARRAG
jgi:NAD(P)-dependent dehydrogenase (short-subunit alcohol dehydrogenase family)